MKRDWRERLIVWLSKFYYWLRERGH
jgi:hypothetical protein